MLAATISCLAACFPLFVSAAAVSQPDEKVVQGGDMHPLRAARFDAPHRLHDVNAHRPDTEAELTRNRRSSTMGGGGGRFSKEMQDAALYVVLGNMKNVPRLAALPRRLKHTIARIIATQLLDIYLERMQSGELAPPLHELYQYMRTPNLG